VPDSVAEAAPAAVARPAPRGALLLCGSALLFGVMSFFAKLASARLPGQEVAAVRFTLSLAVVGLVVTARLATVRVTRAQLPLLVARGVFGGVAVLFYFLAIARGTVGTATLLNFTSPAFTAVFAWVFLRERLSPWAIAALAVAGAGVTLVWRGTAGAGPVGWQPLGLISAVLSGAAVTCIRALRRHGLATAWTVFFFFNAAGLAATAPLAAHGFVAPTGREWLLLAAMSLGAVGGQILMTYALAFVQAAVSGIIQQLTVVTTFALGCGLLGEPLGALALAGTALTIAGVAGAAWLAHGAEPEP
jgi:drug/metabolite transporter (DMT)-like permease